MSIESVSRLNPEWEFGDRIRKVRRSIAQMDQQAMADMLGVSRQVYAAWEAGRTKPSDIVAIAKRVAELWPGRVTWPWLLGGDDDPPPQPPGQSFPRPQRTGSARRLRPVADVVGDRQPELVTVDDRWSWYTKALAENPANSPANDARCPQQGSNLRPADYKSAA